MAPTPQLVTSNPLYLNARTLVYTAQELRKPLDDGVIGNGCADADSFRIRQRAAGANMSVDCMTASVLNRAYIRGQSVTDQGRYRVDFVNATPLNLDVATADGANPRIDSVYLCVEDAQHVGGNSQATVRMVTGTPTGGATLDNRTGIGAAPANMSSILLADILVAASDTSITNAEIRDRRPMGILGGNPITYTNLDCVTFIPAPGLIASSGRLVQDTANMASQQAAALMWLPRRIALATRIRLTLQQGATANTGNYIMAICDASGRPIVATASTAYTGTANQQVKPAVTIAATTLDIGYYWIFWANDAGTASATVQGYATPVSTTGLQTAPTPNLVAFSASGGVTVPATILSMTDQNTLTGAAVTARLSVPIPSLSVG